VPVGSQYSPSVESFERALNCALLDIAVRIPRRCAILVFRSGK